MKKLMLLGGAALLALSGTAIAQSAGSTPAPDATATTAPNDAAAATTAPADTAPPADTAATAPAPAAGAVAQGTAPAAEAAATTPAAPAQATATADAAAKVNADWAKYDQGNKGKLTPLEFGSWILAAKGQNVTAQVEKTKTSKKANLPAVKVLNETATDFAKADTDKDKMISPNELAVYLSA